MRISDWSSDVCSSDLALSLSKDRPFSKGGKEERHFDKLNANGRRVMPMGEMIRMTMDDGADVAVYHTQPNGERRGALVLLQELFGVTDHSRELTDDYAADGYELLSPRLVNATDTGFEADLFRPVLHHDGHLARQHDSDN